MRGPLATLSALLVAAHSAAGAEDVTRGPARAHATVESQAIDDAAVRRRTVLLIAAEAIALTWYGRQNWWQDGFTGDFRTVREGWFGQGTMAGGADKLGHFYTNYAGTRLLTRAFRYAGNDENTALWLGAAVVLGSMTAVEVADGYARRWRFSREDALMNVVGTAAGVLFERSPWLDDMVDLRVHYVPSDVGGDKFDPFGDYSGTTYVAAFKASGVAALRARPWLRHLEFSLGYGTRNYHDARPDLMTQRRRQVYVGVALNLSELLGQTVYRTRPGARSHQAARTILEYVQVPGTAAFVRNRID